MSSFLLAFVAERAACSGGGIRARYPSRREVLVAGGDRAELGLFAAGADEARLEIEELGSPSCSPARPVSARASR